MSKGIWAGIGGDTGDPGLVIFVESDGIADAGSG